MGKVFLIAILASIVLTGCLEKDESVKTVEYYKQNTSEMLEKIKECKSNPGELEHTPNCINAGKAKLGSGKSIPQNW